MTVSNIRSLPPTTAPIAASCYEKIKKIPVIGHIIQAIIALFKKIFPCCFSHTSRTELVVRRIPQTEPNTPLPINPDLMKFLVKLHLKASKARQTVILNNLLIDHPDWNDAVETWKNVSTKDKIWLIRLYELKSLNLDIPELEELPNGHTTPAEDSLELLKEKKEIEATFSNITEVSCNKGLTKCSEVFYLLPNLKILNLNWNQLTKPPNLRHNVKLVRLTMEQNALTSPPDVSANVKLEYLHLGINQLEIPPDLKNNPKLTQLYLGSNNLKNSPDLSQNKELTVLHLFDNQLTTSPDLASNPKITSLQLANNQLTTAPIVTFLSSLEKLYLSDNHIVAPPDVSKNDKLDELSLNNNKLTSSPDVSANPMLLHLYLQYNALTTAPNVSQNPSLMTLRLDINQLTLPPDLTQNPNLRTLSICGNQLTVSPNLSNNSFLKKIYLKSNKLTSAPDGIRSGACLEEVDISCNSLSNMEKDKLSRIAKEKFGFQLTL